MGIDCQPGHVKMKPQSCTSIDRRKREDDNRTTALLVLAAIVAAAVTVEVTYFVLDRFVLHDPNDPLTKAGGLSPTHDPKAKWK
jgi:hypothetical protein